MIQQYLTETKRNKQKCATFNGMDAAEWVKNSKSIVSGFSSPRDEIEKEHGATFPLRLAERYISNYSKEGDWVIDPFCGAGTSGIAAFNLKRKFIGIELNPKFFKFCEQRIPMGNLILGDCIQETENLKTSLKTGIQLSLTSPPYANYIHQVEKTKQRKNGQFTKIHTKVYSDDFRDLGNMEMEQFSEKIEILMKNLYAIHKPDSYSVWVVKDYRNLKNGIPYVDLHSKIAIIGQKAGFLYQDLIVWDQSQGRKLVVMGYPSVMYNNLVNSFIVVLRKK